MRNSRNLRLAFAAGLGGRADIASSAVHAAIQSSNSASLSDPRGFANVVPLRPLRSARCDRVKTFDATKLTSSRAWRGPVGLRLFPLQDLDESSPERRGVRPSESALDQ